MAREMLVTRTVITTRATVLVANLDSNSVEEKEYTVPRTYKDDKALLKAISKLTADTNETPVKIINKEEIETLRGMPEACFIEHSEILPPRTKK